MQKRAMTAFVFSWKERGGHTIFHPKCSINKTTVGARIKSIRNLRGLTQCELAAQLDYASERIESGETSCSVGKLVEMAQVLEVSMDYLLLSSEKKQESRFQKYFENKTEKQMKFLCRLLEAAGDNLKLLC